MKVICAWCNKPMPDKEESNPDTSHGICNSCKDNILQKADKNYKQVKGHNYDSITKN